MAAPYRACASLIYGCAPSGFRFARPTHAVIELALGIFLLFGTQQDQIEITAAGPQGWEQRVYHAKDNVIVTYRDIRIEADEVTYNDDTKIVTAGDHVKFTREEEMLDATHVSFNVETQA